MNKKQILFAIFLFLSTSFGAIKTSIPYIPLPCPTEDKKAIIFFRGIWHYVDNGDTFTFNDPECCVTDAALAKILPVEQQSTITNVTSYNHINQPVPSHPECGAQRFIAHVQMPSTRRGQATYFKCLLLEGKGDQLFKEHLHGQGYFIPVNDKGIPTLEGMSNLSQDIPKMYLPPSPKHHNNSPLAPAQSPTDSTKSSPGAPSRPTHPGKLHAATSTSQHAEDSEAKKQPHANGHPECAVPENYKKSPLTPNERQDQPLNSPFVRACQTTFTNEVLIQAGAITVLTPLVAHMLRRQGASDMHPSLFTVEDLSAMQVAAVVSTTNQQWNYPKSTATDHVKEVATSAAKAYVDSQVSTRIFNFMAQQGVVRRENAIAKDAINFATQMGTMFAYNVARGK